MQDLECGENRRFGIFLHFSSEEKEGEEKWESGDPRRTPNPERRTLMLWRHSLFLLLLGCPLASAGDWPQWLGPNRDGASTEKVEPWKEKPRALWTVPTGEGYSVPVVS